MQKGSLCFFVW